MSQRLSWIDIAKGVGIAFVVLGHAVRGILNADIPDANNILPALDRAIYAFHMPFFFLLSGITFGMRPPRSVSPDLAGRVWRLFFPLVLWTYVFLFFRSLAGDHANAGEGWQDLLILPLPPFAHFWFLWALLVITTVFAVLRFLLVPGVSEVWFWGLALTAVLLANALITVPDHLRLFLQASLIYSPAFAVGALIGSTWVVRAVPSWSYAVAGGLGFVVLLWVTLSFDLNIPGHLSGLVLSMLLILPFMTVSAQYAHLRGARFLAFLGMISLAIYVMHTIFSAGLRAVLISIGTEDLAVHLVLGTVIGIVGPLAVYLVFRRWRVLSYAGLR